MEKEEARGSRGPPCLSVYKLRLLRLICVAQGQPIQTLLDRLKRPRPAEPEGLLLRLSSVFAHTY